MRKVVLVFVVYRRYNFHSSEFTPPDLSSYLLCDTGLLSCVYKSSHFQSNTFPFLFPFLHHLRMTIEVPPAATTAAVEDSTHTKTPVKDLASDETKTEEPTLSIQIEPPTTNNPEDLTLSNEEKPTSAKRKALFNNPFKITKKEAATEASTHTTDIPRETTHAEEKTAAAAAGAAGATTGTGENKITKGLGNLYTRIKVSSLNLA